MTPREFIGLGVGERGIDLGLGRGTLADRGPAEDLLGGYPGQVDARVGVDQAQVPRRTVRHELGVGGDRLGELPILEGKVAKVIVVRQENRLSAWARWRIPSSGLPAISVRAQRTS